MLNPSDKELDRLSREAAEHFEPDEMISSWEQLVPRLDREIGPRPNSAFRYFGRGPLVYGIILVTIIGISFFFVKQKQAADLREKDKITRSSGQAPVNQSSKQTNSTENSTKNEGLQIPGAEKSGSANANANAVDPLSSASENGKQSASTNSPSSLNKGSDAKGNDLNLSENSPSGNQSKKDKATGKPGLTLGAAEVISSLSGHKKPYGNVNVDISNSNNNGATGIAEGRAGAAEKQSPGTSKEIMMSPIAGIVPIDQNVNVSDASLRNHSKSTVQLSAAAIAQSKNTQRVLRMSRALKIGLLYGSDVTAIHSVAPEKLSNSFGLTIGYQFFDHLSVNTGAIYTQKNYSANGVDFHHAMPPGLTNYNLDYVTGNCNMWEVPLTLRYDFDRVGNTTFFVNGGASTYFMMHENYVYYTHAVYNGTTTPVQTPSMPYNTNQSYLFAAIDLSLGVEQKLSKSLSLQVEPYVKIPTKGIGYGKLDLSSYGVNFSLRFAPLLKTSRK